MDPTVMGETIVAVATAEGRAGLSVVRLSGPAALAIARRVTRPVEILTEPVTSHRARLGVVVWPEDAPRSGRAGGHELDQVLVLPLLGPHSFTGEDTVEFSCHGGRMPARMVCDACRAAGARAAAPGEFTRRAFLNGRLSLAQAEAIADLIASEHETGARAALAQLRGGLERELAAVADPLRGVLVELEGAMEFADEEESGPSAPQVAAVVTAALDRIAELAALGPAGRRLREGVQVVLVGAANAGKSSLFNALLGEARAIVDPQPGTTRDVVTAPSVRAGQLFVLHDTAGLRDVGGRIEHEGMQRARAAVAGADVVLHVRAHDAGIEPQVAPPAQAITIRVAAKCDRDPRAGSLWPGADVALTASATGEGIAELWARIETAAQEAGLGEAVARGVVLNARHEDRLRACGEHLAALRDGIAAGETATDIMAGTLRLALLALDEISGRVFSERLLGDIFGRFCVGK